MMIDEDWPELYPDPQSDARAPTPVSPAGLAAGSVPNVPVLTIPARALFGRGVKIGIR